MNQPQTTFTEPQFPLIPDDIVRNYANVSNVLQMIDLSGNAREFTVVVPTVLFTLMKEVLKVQPEEEVTMYIVRDGDKFVFGLMWGENGVTDLWTYTARTLPPFLNGVGL